MYFEQEGLSRIPAKVAETVEAAGIELVERDGGVAGGQAREEESEEFLPVHGGERVLGLDEQGVERPLTDARFPQNHLITYTLESRRDLRF